MLKNTMESAVEDAVEIILKDERYCGCEQCRYDTMAIALNRIKPHYVVTEKGVLYAKTSSIDPEFLSFISTEVSIAAELVHAKPRHS